jgi:hypothetical protein
MDDQGVFALLPHPGSNSQVLEVRLPMQGIAQLAHKLSSKALFPDELDQGIFLVLSVPSKASQDRFGAGGDKIVQVSFRR